jgi:hypothetical protein
MHRRIADWAECEGPGAARELEPLEDLAQLLLRPQRARIAAMRDASPLDEPGPIALCAVLLK